MRRGPWGRKAWICTAPRTGSTWFCYLINAAAGQPMGLPAPDEEARLSAGEHLAHRCRSPDEFFALDPVVSKVHRHHFGKLFPRGTTRSDIEQKTGPLRFVQLRRDPVAQAVSLAFSDRTKVCNLTSEEQRKEYISEPVTLSDEELLRHYDQVVCYDRMWGEWLQDVPVLAIRYAALLHDPERTVRETLAFLETPFLGMPDRVPLYPTTRPESQGCIRRLNHLLERRNGQPSTA